MPSTKRKSKLTPPTPGGVSISIGVDQAPPLWQMGSLVFQQFCTDLLAKDSTLEMVSQYGRSGQSDHGIDIIAHKIDQSGIELAQCKAYGKFPKSKIKAATTDFLKHWDTKWHDQKVQKFSLLVGCDLTGADQQSEILAQKKVLKEYDVLYSCLSAYNIRNLLSPYPDLVMRYFGTHAASWASDICPAVRSYQRDEHAIVNTALVTQIAQLSPIIDGDTKAIIELAIRRWKEGNSNLAITDLRSLESNSQRWLHLESETQAQILCLQGEIELERQQIENAKSLEQRASNLGAFESIVCLRALIALFEGKKDEAQVHLENALGLKATQIKSSLLLNEGNVNEALALIDSSDDADSLRQKALCLVFARQITNALATVDKALAIEPKWKQTRFVSAIVRYFNSISPIEIPKSIPEWPSPAHWSMVRDSDDARARLEEAETILRELLADPNLEHFEKRIFRNWLIATLANNPPRRALFNMELERTIKENPLDECSIAWIISRNTGTELETSYKSLKSICETDMCTVDNIIALQMLLIDRQELNEAKIVLDKFEQRFTELGRVNSWKFWKAQTLILNGEYEQLPTIYQGENFPSELSLLTSSEETFEKLCGVKSLDEFDGFQLLSWSTIQAGRNNWNEIAKVSKRLIEDIQTPQALQIAVNALFMTHQYEPCLKALESQRQIFANSALPYGLQIIQADCNSKLGLVNTALQQAEEAANRHPNLQTLLHYARLLEETGNRKSLLLVVKKLSKLSNLTALHLLRLAESIRVDDSRLARNLWIEAVSKKVPDKLVPTALILGYQLGCERERQFFAVNNRMSYLARNNPDLVQQISVKELIEMQKKHLQQIEIKRNAYETGSTPAHLISDLAWLLFCKKVERSQIWNDSSLFCMHENHVFFQDILREDVRWQIIADVSSILLAERFGFLDSIFTAFQKISTSAATIPCLVKSRKEISALPESRKVFFETITTLIEKKQLHIIDAPSEVPLMDFFNRTCSGESAGAPLIVIAEIEKTEEKLNQEVATAVDSRSISLQMLSKILRQNDSESAEYEISDASTNEVILTMGALERLHVDGLLEKCCLRFQASILRNDFAAIHFELSKSDIESTLQNDLTKLIDKLNHRLLADELKLLPRFIEPKKGMARELKMDHDEAEDQYFQAICSLCLVPTSADQLILVDDRYANHHPSTEQGIRVISSWEVLRSLRARTILSDDEYYAALLSMRSSGVRFIPIFEDEILYHLNRELEKKSARETEGLQILRRYISYCLAKLPSDKVDQHEHGTSFSTTLGFSIFNTWKAIWCSDSDFSVKVTKANWIIGNLYADPLSLAIQNTLNGFTEKLDLAQTITGLLFVGVSVLVTAGNSQSHAEAYVEWFFNKIIMPLSQNNPKLIPEIAQKLQEFMIHFMSTEEDHDTRLIFGWLYMALPKKIHDQVAKSTQLLNRLGISRVSNATICGYTFKINELELALKKVLLDSANTQTVIAEDGTQFSIFGQNTSSGEPSFTFGSNDVAFSVLDDAINLIAASPAKRREILEKNKGWIDVVDFRLTSIISDIAYSEPAYERLKKLDEWQNRNYNVYLSHLREKLISESRLKYFDFRPNSVESLLNHFDINETYQFSNNFNVEHMTTSNERFGLLLACLPLSLEEPFFANNCANLNVRTLVKSMLKVWTPLCRIQLLKVLQVLGDQPQYTRLRRFVIRRIMHQGTEPELAAFEALFDFIHSSFAQWEPTQELSPGLRLVLCWLHTSKLFDIFTEAGVSLKWMSENFSHAKLQIGNLFLDYMNPLYDDAASKNYLSPERLLITGVLYCMTKGELIEHQKQLIDIALVEIDGKVFPKPDLVRANAPSNCLNSFLGINVSDICDAIPAFESVSEQKIAETIGEALSNIEKSTNTAISWLILATIAPSRNYSSVIDTCIVELLRKRGLYKIAIDSEFVSVPLSICSKITSEDKILTDEIQRDLYKIANDAPYFLTQLSKREIKEPVDTLCVSLVQACLSICRNNDKIDFPKFTTVSIEISKRWREYGIFLGEMIDSKWSVFPIEVSAALWKLRTELNSIHSGEIQSGC
jgi:tetratricopeptide (TPR) repeat protein